jgi:hypothetical protein
LGGIAGLFNGRKDKRKVSSGGDVVKGEHLQKSKGRQENKVVRIQWDNKRNARGRRAGHNGGREQEREGEWGTRKTIRASLIYAQTGSLPAFFWSGSAAIFGSLVFQIDPK